MPRTLARAQALPTSRPRLRWPALAALAVASAACGGKEPPPPPPRAVRVIEVAPRDGALASRHAGALEPRRRVELRFEVAGRVASLLEVEAAGGRRAVQDGDSVRRGQVLATLDPRDFSLQANAAAAALETARAQERAAKAALEKAELDARRARFLFESETIPRAELDKAETALATARDALAGARAQARAQAEQVALARGSVADTRLVAPFDGVVGRRGTDVGETISPGQPAFTLLDVGEMRTVFGVPDVRVGDLRQGQRVPVEVDAFPGRVILGTVTMIAPVPDPALRSYAVEVTIPNEDGRLRAGMVATASLARDDRTPATLVPLSAVARGPGGKGFVAFVVGREGTASARPIELGDLHDNDVNVREGLSPGDRVVVEGAQLLHDGARVEVVP